MRRIRYVFLLAAMLAGAADGMANTGDAAVTMIRDTTDRVIERLRAEGDGIENDSMRLAAIAEELIVPHFDFVRMSKRVLGPNWQQADAAQQDRFTRAFKKLLVNTYAGALVGYRDRPISYLPPKPLGADRVVVRTKVALEHGEQVDINYALYGAGDSWKVFDVSIAGVSLVINYRTQFGSTKGRSALEDLIAKIEKKTAYEGQIH